MMTPKVAGNDLNEMKRELKALRSFAIGVLGKDKEGEYRPEFVEQILNDAQDEIAGVYTDAESFLASINE